MNYSLRRKQLLEKIDEGIIILFSGSQIQRSADECYPFVVNRNFYYLTGITQQDSYLVLNKNDNTETLYINDNDENLAKWIGCYLFPEQASEISQIEDIKSNQGIEKILNELASDNQTVYLDLEKTDFKGGVNQGERISNLLLKDNPTLIIKDIYPEFVKMRMVKDEDEIKALRHSIEITKLALESVMKNIKSFKTEKEAQAHFEERIASLGNAETSFPTIAAGGINAATLHYSSNNQPFNKEDMILMDLGASCDLYCADITRTYSHMGKYSTLQKEIYEIVLYCNKKIISIIKPGVTLGELQEMTKAILADGLKELKIIKNDDEIGKYYFHGISHHLGLDTHDTQLTKDTPLVPGNVITVEPGLYMPEYKIGVRIEDDVLVTEDGSDNLSKDIIKEIAEIEKFINE